MMYQPPTESPVCNYCEHIVSIKDRRCKAFDKIPLNIWVGLHDHKSGYFGDGGLRYSPAYDEEELGESIGDVAVAVPVFGVVCRKCVHLDVGAMKCAAYDMIPLEIWLGLDDHRNPYPGDGGIMYKETGG